MDMTIFQIATLIFGSGGLLGFGYLIFKTGAIVERIKNNEKKQDIFETNVGRKFDEVDERFNKLDDRLGRIEASLVIISIQIGKLETRVEERTLRVVHVRPDEKEPMAK